MGRGFNEVAHLRGDDKKYEENFNSIDWTTHNESKPKVAKAVNGFYAVKVAKVVIRIHKETKEEICWGIYDDESEAVNAVNRLSVNRAYEYVIRDMKF